MNLELRVPPVAVFVAAALLMWAVSWLFPVLNLALPGRVPAAILAVLIGAIAGISGVAEFRRARTTVNPLKPETSSALVAEGIFRLTRNPMYLGLALVLLGWGIFLSNPASLAMLFVFVGYLNRFQIIPEERALESRFGTAFKAYRSRVRRWL